jgi:hypothetical protein
MLLVYCLCYVLMMVGTVGLVQAIVQETNPWQPITWACGAVWPLTLLAIALLAATSLTFYIITGKEV